MKNISVKEAKELIDKGEAKVIDVRTKDEFIDGHIHEAQNINFNDPMFRENIGALDKEGGYIVNCQTGGRSSRATSLMEELGFKNVMNLDGGISAWKNEGMSVV